jgi:hypothetical protein
MLDTQPPVTPAGSPETVAPVAPVVEYVIVVIAVLMHRIWLFVPAAEVRVIVFAGVTVIVPVALTVPHPPVKGIL